MTIGRTSDRGLGAKALTHHAREPDPMTPGEFAQFIRDELALHARIIKTAGLKVE